jgi:hypothetical protein
MYARRIYLPSRVPVWVSAPGTMFRVLAWHDDKWCFATRRADTPQALAKLI